MSHEPKKRHSRARQGKRRANIKLQIPSFAMCMNCKATVYPHTICKKCGFYNGKQIVTIQAKEKNPHQHAANGGKTA